MLRSEISFDIPRLRDYLRNMTKTTTREMKTKPAADGKQTVIAQGEKVTVAFDVPSGAEKSASRFSVTTGDGRRIVTRDFKAVGFKVPGLATLEKYSDDGVAKSVFGARVEPDGWDANGSPSWMLAAGLM